jgi:hypothetical protein
MSDNKTSSGAGFTSLLLIAFIVLKLCNVIDWSWWWVLSPAWITAGIVVIGLVTIHVLEKISDRKLSKISKKHAEAASELMSAIDEAKKSTSRWQERLNQMEQVKTRADQARNQSELDEKLRKDA